MKALRRYDNWLYTFAVLLSAFFIWQTRDPMSANVFLPSKILGNLATLFLFLSLLPSAINAETKVYPGRMWLITNRKSHGIASFIFALGHGFVALFSILGGISGLMTYDLTYQIIVIVGVIAFDILTILFITSSIFAMKKLGIWWKRLHRLVYLAGLLVLAHIVAVRVYYFYRLTEPLSIISSILFTMILWLELKRFYKYLNRKKNVAPAMSPPPPTQIPTPLA